MKICKEAPAAGTEVPRADVLEILDGLMSQATDVHPAEIRFDPFLQELAGDPRFEAILAKAQSID